MGKTGKLLVLFLIISTPSFAVGVSHGKMEKRAYRLDRWYRVVWVLMWTVFLLFLFIVL
jgi:hypothetical protein